MLGPGGAAPGGFGGSPPGSDPAGLRRHVGFADRADDEVIGQRRERSTSLYSLHRARELDGDDGLLPE
jgi:hypothetical protein